MSSFPEGHPTVLLAPLAPCLQNRVEEFGRSADPIDNRQVSDPSEPGVAQLPFVVSEPLQFISTIRPV